MTRAVFAALLLACAARAGGRSESDGAAEVAVPGEEADFDDDGEGDVAPFMIVVEHADGWRCSGSLVSLRTALTSAWCARGRGALPARELWALSAAAGPAADPRALRHAKRRVARLALAAGADAEVADAGDPGAGTWRGGAMDLAIVELEEPFGQAARARPILMSTTGEECAPGPPGSAQCHVSRAVTRPGSRRARLRIVGAALVAPDACAAAADHWAGVRDRALCLTGPELCESDWGGGVVCGGKLCGVVSRSLRAARAAGGGPRGDAAGDVAGDAASDAAGDACGDTHAAQSVSRWRRFLHCAHTLRACGRGGDCADLCIERRLIEEPETDPPATEPPSTEPPAPESPSPEQLGPESPVPEPPVAFAEAVAAAVTAPAETRARISTLASQKKPAFGSPAYQHPTRTSAPRQAASRTAAAPGAAPDAQASPRPSFEFEPNRADFKAAPTRSTRVYLKAGEYGDNAAEYGGEEAAPPAPSPSPPEPPSRTPRPLANATAAGPPAERRAAPAERPVAAPAGRALRSSSTFLLFLPFIYVFTAIKDVF